MRYKHGMTKSKTYLTWQWMKTRCLNKNSIFYRHYGGRGINICERWLSFENFLSDMGQKPENMTIERIDNNKGYSPRNCAWATHIENSNNKRSNHFVKFKGEKLSLKQWSRKLNISYNALRNRITRDRWSIEKAFTQPERKHRPFEVTIEAL